LESNGTGYVNTKHFEIRKIPKVRIRIRSRLIKIFLRMDEIFFENKNRDNTRIRYK
jgi:hypothetical protein